MATRLDMIEEHISQIESTQRRDMDLQRAKSQGDSCRRMLWLKVLCLTIQKYVALCENDLQNPWPIRATSYH